MVILVKLFLLISTFRLTDGPNICLNGEIYVRAMLLLTGHNVRNCVSLFGGFLKVRRVKVGIRAEIAKTLKAMKFVVK